MERDAELVEMFGQMYLALEEIEVCAEFGPMVPEVRSNLVYAREDAQNPEDVLAIDGRITVVEGRARAAGRPRLGASSHMARLIIELRRTEPTFRAGVNFRADSDELIAWLERYASERGWVFSVIDRSMEPEELHDEERASMPWKVAEVVRAAGGRAPKLFYETAAMGKEPVAVLVGADPLEVVREACEIARKWGERDG